MENLVTLTYRGTHTYLVSLARGWLLVDAGWAGSLGAVERQLRGYRIALSEIVYVLLTHTHPDHAGLAQTLKRAAGARLILHASQVPLLPGLAAFYAGKAEGYEPIVVEPGDVVLSGETRAALAGCGIAGEVVETPGHSVDSVSLVLDSGRAFTGDLPLPGYGADGAADRLVLASWHSLLARGALVFHPSHAGPLGAEQVRAALAGPG
jgi:glyoxylase-like metal-dependent hydrolase (beta-lactamase superfamily II)